VQLPEHFLRYFPRNISQAHVARGVGLRGFHISVCHNLQCCYCCCATFAGALFTCFAHLLRLLLAKFAIFFLFAADFIGAISKVNSLKAPLLLLPFYLCSLLPANLQQHIKIN